MTSTTPQRSDRFAYSLRFLFIVVTLVCLWLGWHAYWNRWAGGVLARERAIVEVLNGNMATAPYGTTAKPEALFYVPRTVRSLTGANPPDTIALASIELGIPKITDWQQRLELMDTIHKHYVAGLEDVGLNASQGSAFDANSMNTRTSILVSETRNLQLNYCVVITITADFAEPRANVRVYLLCTE